MPPISQCPSFRLHPRAGLVAVRARQGRDEPSQRSWRRELVGNCALPWRVRRGVRRDVRPSERWPTAQPSGGEGFTAGVAYYGAPKYLFQSAAWGSCLGVGRWASGPPPRRRQLLHNPFPSLLGQEFPLPLVAATTQVLLPVQCSADPHLHWERKNTQSSSASIPSITSVTDRG